MFEVTRTDEGYVSVQHPEVIRSEHRAFRPIDVKMGPDGALSYLAYLLQRTRDNSNS
jgi:hypothetical protein